LTCHAPRWWATPLVTRSAAEHWLIQTMHHMLADGWSYPVIFGDIVAHYNAAVGAGPQPVAARVTLREHIESVLNCDPAPARRAWSAALAGAEPAILFPAGSDPSAKTAIIGEHRSRVRLLGPELTEALTRTARERGVTVSTAVHGAWGLLLGRLLGRRQVVFGSTVSGRGGGLDGTESIVGLLINTVPVPMSWDDDTPIALAMSDLQDRQGLVMGGHHLGLRELARLAGVREFFDTIVVVENFPTARTTPPDGANGICLPGLHRHGHAALPAVAGRLSRRFADAGDQIRHPGGDRAAGRPVRGSDRTHPHGIHAAPRRTGRRDRHSHRRRTAFRRGRAPAERSPAGSRRPHGPARTPSRSASAHTG
jgi:Condensation domain